MKNDRIMTKERATAFFAEFYQGEHRIPGELKQWGTGWAVNHRGDISTWDWPTMTRLVVMAHDDAFRVSVAPARHDLIRIAIHPRNTGFSHNDHPPLEGHIEQIRTRRIYWKNRHPGRDSVIADGKNEDPGSQVDDEPGDRSVVPS